MAAVATQAPAAAPHTLAESMTYEAIPIIDNIDQSAGSGPVKFEPSKHLNYTPPESIVMMKDIGYAEDIGISPVAVSQPFPLFSKAAVNQMRNEIVKPQVMDNCKFQSNIAACQLRGYAPKYATINLPVR